MENQENATLACPSDTTTEQPPVQPPVQEPVQPPAEVPTKKPTTGFIRGKWSLAELKKVKRTRAKIIAMYKALRRPTVYNGVNFLRAVEFFRAEWPERSPYAAYQKAHNLKGKKFFIV